MFRTTISILLLSLFLLTQYGRQAAYLQCKVENFSKKTTTAACDCERDYKNVSGATDNQLPPQKNHVHISLDEYYEINENETVYVTGDLLVTYARHSTSLLASFHGNIFHPPQL